MFLRCILFFLICFSSFAQKKYRIEVTNLPFSKTPNFEIIKGRKNIRVVYKDLDTSYFKFYTKKDSLKFIKKSKRYSSPLASIDNFKKLLKKGETIFKYKKDSLIFDLNKNPNYIKLIDSVYFKKENDYFIKKHKSFSTVIHGIYYTINVTEGKKVKTTFSVKSPNKDNFPMIRRLINETLKFRNKKTSSRN